MEIEGKNIEKRARRFLLSWPPIRLVQLLLGLFALGYFLQHPGEWIALPVGLALSGLAISGRGCPGNSAGCER